MSGTPRPVNVDATTENVLLMIDLHQGRNCPTRQEIMEWTGLARRRVWPFMQGLEERGLIEMESRGEGDSVWRRMRVIGRSWTGWTQRRKPSLSRKEQLMADAAGVGDG